jgi:hypothetical protein
MKESNAAAAALSSPSDSQTNLSNSCATNSANSTCSGRLSGRKSASPTIFHFNADHLLAAASSPNGIGALKKSTTAHDLHAEFNDEDSQEPGDSALVDSTAETLATCKPPGSAARSKSLSPSLRRAFQHPRLRHKRPKHHPPNTPNDTAAKFFFQPINPAADTTNNQTGSEASHDNTGINKRKAMSFDQVSLDSGVKKPVARLASDKSNASQQQEPTSEINTKSESNSNLVENGNVEKKNLIHFVIRLMF